MHDTPCYVLVVLSPAVWFLLLIVYGCSIPLHHVHFSMFSISTALYPLRVFYLLDMTPLPITCSSELPLRTFFFFASYRLPAISILLVFTIPSNFVIYKY